MSDEQNEIIRYFKIVRPQLWDEPDFQRVAFLLHHISVQRETIDWDVICDAFIDLLPEQKEFWLRVNATWNTQFIEAMTASFNEDPDSEASDE